jgi:hypothetical protein
LLNVASVVALTWFSMAAAIGREGGALQAGGQPRPVAAERTPWGEPDLQGIWTDDYQTPLQRPAKYAGKEFFTDAEVADLDRQRAGILRRDYRAARGTEADVGGAYNAVFQSVKHTGHRTSMIVDPPDGRIPAMTPAAAKMRADVRGFQLALLQATEVCRKTPALPGTPIRNGVAGGASCAGGQFGPPSPRRFDRAPFYVIGGLNRADGPEDRNLSERCMSAQLPDFSGYRRIVQSPAQIAIFYDVGQGQGWQRVIPVTANPHLPSTIRQWWGDSRAGWDGGTLVVDVTNFSSKTDYLGSRNTLHLVERWSRIDRTALEYSVTVDDPATWVKPWTVKQLLTRQDDRANRIYDEPRCHEGNYGLMGVLVGARTAETAFAEGRGPDPATLCTAIGGNCGGVQEEDNQDPLDQ